MVYTDKDRVRVIVATPVYRIEGDMHVLKDSRLTDALNSKAKEFFAITQAQVFDLQTAELLYEAEYVALNRSAISVIIPL